MFELFTDDYIHLCLIHLVFGIFIPCFYQNHICPSIADVIYQKYKNVNAGIGIDIAHMFNGCASILHIIENLTIASEAHILLCSHYWFFKGHLDNPIFIRWLIGNLSGCLYIHHILFIVVKYILVYTCFIWFQRKRNTNGDWYNIHYFIRNGKYHFLEFIRKQEIYCLFVYANNWVIVVRFPGQISGSLSQFQLPFRYFDTLLYNSLYTQIIALSLSEIAKDSLWISSSKQHKLSCW